MGTQHADAARASGATAGRDARKSRVPKRILLRAEGYAHMLLGLPCCCLLDARCLLNARRCLMRRCLLACLPGMLITSIMTCPGRGTVHSAHGLRAIGMVLAVLCQVVLCAVTSSRSTLPGSRQVTGRPEGTLPREPRKRRPVRCTAVRRPAAGCTAPSSGRPRQGRACQLAGRQSRASCPGGSC